MNRYLKALFILLLAAGMVVLTIVLSHSGSMPVLHPTGVVGREERDLILLATALMLVVVLPVFAMTFWIVWKYREDNTEARYSPDWDHSVTAETLWWGLPCAIILVLAVVTWKTSHSLDPFHPLDSNVPPITIQVVALPWKWLFIYPDQGVASVNYVQFPANTPVKFEITADAPMNSFWIPALGGQMYAMPGMSTQLNLMADGSGTYEGSSANLSGSGFAGMKFTARSTSVDGFNNWLRLASASAPLTVPAYQALAAPSSDVAPASYALTEKDLYSQIIMKYMMPANMPGMTMTMPGMYTP